MDAARLRAYRENLEFYQGRQWLDPVRRRDRRLTLNYAKTVIEKTGSYTMSGVSVVVVQRTPRRRRPRGRGARSRRFRRCTRRTGSSSWTSITRSTARCWATPRIR